ncbi:MAG: hypothetical protein ACTHK7_24170 [Aureliella sp.]
MAIEIGRFRFDQPADGVDPITLRALDAKLGGCLDDDYLEFLSKINGGLPDPALVSSFALLPFPILVFLGTGESKSNLLGAYEDLAQSIGDTNLVPIAYDTALRRICLKVGWRRSPVVVVSVDDLYFWEPTRIAPVCGSFSELWESLSQPRKLVAKFEELAQRTWDEIQSVVATNREYYLGASSDELSLLCQVIRAENEDAFFGLVAAGAKLDGALKIAIICERFDFVQKLVQCGADATEGVPYAVGPSRKQIREYLQKYVR